VQHNITATQHKADYVVHNISVLVHIGMSSNKSFVCTPVGVFGESDWVVMKSGTGMFDFTMKRMHGCARKGANSSARFLYLSSVTCSQTDTAERSPVVGAQ
jgi:hypothetical protein